MDPRERFTATVSDYRRFRPSYPSALFDWIEAEAGLQRGDQVVDVGCGTGITSRLLAARGLRVIGVDPNEAMLEAAREEGGEGVTWVVGDAETLPIEGQLTGPLKAIVGGQAFHWLDLDRALARFGELLAEGGRVIPFWNLRDTRQPLMARYESLLRRHSTDYARVGAEPRAEALMAGPLASDRVAAVPHQQRVDRDGFLGRVWSSSYVRHGLVEREAFDASLEAMFAEFEREGTVCFDYLATAVSLEV